MNVIVANEQHSNLMNNLDVDIIKSVNGTYPATEIVEMFSSFFYSKMILDVTAIKDFDSIDTYTTLVRGLGAEKIIFLLPQGSVLCTPSFLCKLIDLGIYNFTTNLGGIKYLIKKPNTLKDVEHIKNLAETQKKKAIEKQKAIEKAEADAKARAEAEEKAKAEAALKKSESSFTNSIKEKIADTFSGENDSSTSRKSEEVVPVSDVEKKSMVIGVKNVTDHAGATTFIYMLKREIGITFGKENVIAVEINKNDFQLFNDKSMTSVKEADINSFINSNKNYSINLFDLNNAVDYSFCNDVIYLVEPSTIMLNKLIRRNKNIFTKLNGKKVVLNKSLLLNNDVIDFENEAGCKIFYHMPPLSERNRNAIINDFLSKMGLFTDNKNSVSDKIFGLFRR